ncbi:putative serine esterase-domain-containing protein [Geopyxis carbonaria]|nr:putative serine esterase-domain-containing protein [Geopyxis carbonaria]
MLLLHTTGITKIGEVRRYTVTYTPGQDSILPVPSALHLRIKNTASLPLRAAYLHGPYTLYVSVRRKEFQPWSSKSPGTAARNEQLKNDGDRPPCEQEEEGIPVFDPNLKAGASFYATLPVPPELLGDDITPLSTSRVDSFHQSIGATHENGSTSRHREHDLFEESISRKSVTWIIEIISQVIFSTNATVGYEILLSRDDKSLSLGLPFGPGNSPQTSTSNYEDQTHETLSHAVTVKVQGTKQLWNIPPFPSWENEHTSTDQALKDPEDQDEAREKRQKKRSIRKSRKVHLVILTHGLHSNTGADMLFLKEAIDEEDSKASILRQEQRNKDILEGKSSIENDDDDEMVIVRGYHDNACNTGRGIKFLGKRLAKFILHLCNPAKNPPPRVNTHNKLQKRSIHHHPHLTTAGSHYIQNNYNNEDDVPPYKVTSISFIGHSLGGLVQTYAIAYIHAHSPGFFHRTRPVNFVTLATPFLGLSNENPLYVRFALDFGLVGKTGQDLGLSWKTPNALAAITSVGLKGSLTGGDSGSKPLLSILPTGPAHEVLKMFRNRTVYANVVNDGIVPLRTSCLLFLDWKGLGRVEKARRENGTVGGLMEWGLGQLITHGSSNGTWKMPTTQFSGFSFPHAFNTGLWGKHVTTGTTVETTSGKKTEEKNPISEAPLKDEIARRDSFNNPILTRKIDSNGENGDGISRGSPNTFSSIVSLLMPNAASKKEHNASGSSKRATKIYHRSQTQPVRSQSSSGSPNIGSPILSPTSSSSMFEEPASLSSTTSATRGEPSIDQLMAPPKTTIFEAASDVLNPPLPTTDFIINEYSRPRTIFHERVYHANDIPAPQCHPRKQHSDRLSTDCQPPDMKVEEKIARAYHKDMSWRKVLVRLEPDAHNNMIVRRMFANAYGWPVVQHVVETHFGLSGVAVTRDEDESSSERILIPDGLDNNECTHWTEDEWKVTDESESEDDMGSKFLGMPEGLKRPPEAAKRQTGTVRLSNVVAEATDGSERPKRLDAVGLGLRRDGNDFGSNSGSEAMRMLELCRISTRDTKP